MKANVSVPRFPEIRTQISFDEFRRHVHVPEDFVKAWDLLKDQYPMRPPERWAVYEPAYRLLRNLVLTASYGAEIFTLSGNIASAYDLTKNPHNKTDNETAKNIRVLITRMLARMAKEANYPIDYCQLVAMFAVQRKVHDYPSDHLLNPTVWEFQQDDGSIALPLFGRPLFAELVESDRKWGVWSQLTDLEEARQWYQVYVDVFQRFDKQFYLANWENVIQAKNRQKEEVKRGVKSEGFRIGMNLVSASVEVKYLMEHKASEVSKPYSLVMNHQLIKDVAIHRALLLKVLLSFAVSDRLFRHPNFAKVIVGGQP